MEAERVPLCHSLSLREGVRVTVDHHTVCVAIDDIQTQLCGEEVVRPNPLPLAAASPSQPAPWCGRGSVQEQSHIHRKTENPLPSPPSPYPHLSPLALTSLPLPLSPSPSPHLSPFASDESCKGSGMEP